MNLHLKIIGALLIILALVHIGFPKRFNWKEELKQLSLINKQMMEVHTFFIAFIIFLIGLLCLTCTNDLIETPLGKKIALGIGVFWLFRLYFQFFVYSSKLWKGKKFEVSVHLFFSVLWLYLVVIFFKIFFS